MSDTNLGNSSIELSDIRQLDILLTQCETSSCENICNDCCARLGSLEDDDDTSSGATDGDAQPNTKNNEKNFQIVEVPTEMGDNDIHNESLSVGEHLLAAGRDVISNVPILSYVTEASTPTPTDHGDVDADDVGEVETILSAAAMLAPLSCENVRTSETGSNVRNPSLGNVCSRCGGVKVDAFRRDFTKKRYFSLDKERNMKNNSTSLLSTSREEHGGSDNILNGCRKHCSFEDNCGKSDCSGKSCEYGPQTSLKSPPSKKSSHRSDNTSSKSNPMSSKSSQTSLKDSRSRKNSLFQGASDRDSSIRSKVSSHPTSRKFSIRAHLLGTSDEQEQETREKLLGKKFDSFQHESLKIPEPVEAVCFVF